MLATGRDYRSAAKYSATFPKIQGCPKIEGSTLCSRANTTPTYTMNSYMCSTHPYVATHFVIVPFLMRTAEETIQIVVVEN